MADRVNKEMKALEERMEEESPGHPWIPLFILALRTDFYYITNARHGHRSNWHVVLPAMELWPKLEKVLRMDLFTPQNASDESHVVHRILLSNIGHKKVINGQVVFESVLENEEHQNVLFSMEIISPPGANKIDYKLDGVPAIRNQKGNLGNVSVHVFILKGILGRKSDISQIKK